MTRQIKLEATQASSAFWSASQRLGVQLDVNSYENDGHAKRAFIARSKGSRAEVFRPARFDLKSPRNPKQRLDFHRGLPNGLEISSNRALIMDRPRITRLVKPRKAAKWTQTSAASRPDLQKLQRWARATENSDGQQRDFSQYNVQPDVPSYDAETYEKHLTHADWSKEETDYLIDLYRECGAKWPVIVDHYAFETSNERSMEDLKARFYNVSATLLQQATPITSMTAADYSLYEMLSKFNPEQETSRKKLAEGHLYRKANEVDEEAVLLGELQRIMVNQAQLDSQREELRSRLSYPPANTSSYQYTTSQALTSLWQQLLAQDRMRKNPRLKPTGNPAFDGFPAPTPTSARPRDSITGQSDAPSVSGRRPTRDSLPSAVSQGGSPADLSKADMLRLGVVQQQDKLPNGVTFASDKLSKPRIAKSTVQTEKIAHILQHIGVPELIPLPTPAVIERFEQIMQKVHQLLDLRKLADKEEHELKVRSQEAAS